MQADIPSAIFQRQTLMNFYEIIGADDQPSYESTLAAAHRTAKCKRPYQLVTIELVEFDTQKAGVQGMLDALFKADKELPQPVRTGVIYGLTPRGGLRLKEGGAS